MSKLVSAQETPLAPPMSAPKAMPTHAQKSAQPHKPKGIADMPITKQTAPTKVHMVLHFTPKDCLVWGCLGALGLWLGFPNALLHVPFLVLLYPAALALLGIAAYTQGQSPVQALRHGWLTGLAGASAALYWLAIPIENVGGLPLALAIPCAMAMGAYVGLYGGMFSLGAYYGQKYLAKAPLRQIILLAVLWYGLEMLRNVAFTGFPWLTLSAAFAPYPLLIQGASVLGAYGLSAAYVLMALAFGRFCIKALPLRQRLSSLALCSVLLVALGGHGLYALMPAEQDAAPKATLKDTANSFPVIMVEGNIDQNIKWEPQLQQSTLQLYMDLSRKALQDLRQENAHAQALVLWPETAMPFFLENHPVLGRQLLRFVREVQSPLVVGAPAMNRDPQGGNRPFNRAYSLSENGELWGYYDKVHLVPFGEYVPHWLQWNILEGLLQSIGAFSAGTQEKPLQSALPISNGNTLPLALGLLICYEGIFPELAHKRVELGANVLVNLSNDGWFGDSAAPLQHLHLTLMRAVEQGRWLIRNTNTGISAIIDAQGTIRLQGSQFKAQSLLGYAKTRQKKTVFHTLYTWLPWAMLALGILCLGTIWLSQRNITSKKSA